MIGIAQHAQSPKQRTEITQSCALTALLSAEASHFSAQMTLTSAVDVAPCAREIVARDHRSRPCQHGPVSNHAWRLRDHLHVVSTHQLSAVRKLARRRPKPLGDRRRENGSKEMGRGPVFAEGEAWHLLWGSVVAAEIPSGCSGQRTSFGCFGARVVAFRSLRRGIRARLVPRRGRLVHSLIPKEQPQVEAIPRISSTKFTEDEWLELVAGIRSDVVPRTEGT